MPDLWTDIPGTDCVSIRRQTLQWLRSREAELHKIEESMSQLKLEEPVPDSKPYRVEIRFDIAADTDTDAQEKAAYAASLHPGGEVTAIFNEEWEEL